MSTLLFHLYQIVFIYLPGAAIIPVTLVLSLGDMFLAVVFFCACVAIICLGFALRSRVAKRLGLPPDYE